MPAFDRLPADELRLLAEEVWRLHRDGVRQHFIDLLRSEGEAIDETEVAQFVDLRPHPANPSARRSLDLPIPTRWREAGNCIFNRIASRATETTAAAPATSPCSTIDGVRRHPAT